MTLDAQHVEKAKSLVAAFYEKESAERDFDHQRIKRDQSTAQFDLLKDDLRATVGRNISKRAFVVGSKVVVVRYINEKETNVEIIEQTA